MITEKQRIALSPMMQLNIVFLIGLFILEMIWGYWAGFSFDITSTKVHALFLIILLSFGFFYSFYRPDKDVSSLMIWLAYFLSLMAGIGILSYLAASANFPLMDQVFTQTDLAMGFDWVGFFAFSSSHEWLFSLMKTFYNITIVLLLSVLVYLVVTGKHKIAEIYMTALFIGGVTVCLLSAPFPAISPYAFLGLTEGHFNGYKPLIVNKDAVNYFLDDFYALRDGSLRSLSLLNMTGVVSFPSFHAYMAFLPVFALRGSKWGYRFVLFVFVITLTSLPTIGGHYMIEVVAGLILTWVSWVLAEKLYGYMNEKKVSSKQPSQILPA